MVAAKASVTIPIDFEGSSHGSVVVYARSDGLSVTFAGKVLESSPAAIMGATGMAYSAGWDNPTNGDLVVKNTTGTPMQAAGGTMILTSRHLAIKPSPTHPRKGERTSYEASLTEATAADDLTASIWNAEGNSTPAVVTKLGTGQWTILATFSEAGDNFIRATTTGTHLREASSTVSVVAGDVTFSPGFDEQVVDSNRDGLIDKLVLTPTITIPSAGEYQALAKLVDASGFEVATNGQGAVNLAAGSQPISLEFDGKYIYQSGRWGPYTLEVTIDRSLPLPTTIDVADARLGQTAVYDYMQFQHDRIAVDPKSMSSKAVDTNGDGLYDELDITGTVTVETPGLYALNSGLYGNKPFGQVAAEYMTFQLAAGANSFTLVYKGSDIAKSGVDGPYTLLDLDVYLSADPMDAPGPIQLNYSTPPYKASQFAG
jgi:hypothetical protein